MSIFCGHCVYEWLLMAPALLVGGKHLYSKLRDVCSTERKVTEREEIGEQHLRGASIDTDTWDGVVCNVCRNAARYCSCFNSYSVTQGTSSPELHAPLMGCADTEPRGNELVWCRRCGHGSSLHTPDCQYTDSEGPCLCGEFRGLGACTLPAQEPDVHTRHCCPECGCKYGEDMTCSVARGWKKANSRCEYCAYRERECRMCS